MAYYLPANTNKCFGYFQKCYCDVTFGYPSYPIFYQFVRNAFLGKVSLNQGKIIFLFKSYFKKPSSGACPPIV